MFEKEVKAGAALLDKKRPGWRHQVDPAILDIGSLSRCILGQIYGEYTAGCQKLRLNTVTRRESLGFTAPPSDWPLLTKAWKKGLQDA